MMDEEAFAERLHQLKAIAVLRTDDAERARNAMAAAVRGGFRVVEFTLNTPQAFALIEEFARRDELLVGAGTVLTTKEAQRAVDAGAQFLVSPVTDRAVIGAATSLGVTAIPGAFTPTEMLRTYELGATLVKLFPGPGSDSSDGTTYVRQVLGPLPFLRIVPTAGVDEHNATAYLDAGAWAVGFGSSLFAGEDLQADRFDRIEQRAHALLAAVV